MDSIVERKSYRWFPFVTAIFVTVLIISNIIAVKLVSIGGLVLPAAVILFPIGYIFGDILTEVYGYANARKVIWTGFFCNLLAVIAIWIGGILPAAPFWSAGNFQSPDTAQQAYSAILGFTPRLLVASFIAYLIGEFLNSFVENPTSAFCAACFTSLPKSRRLCADVNRSPWRMIFISRN